MRDLICDAKISPRATAKLRCVTDVNASFLRWFALALYEIHSCRPSFRRKFMWKKFDADLFFQVFL